METKKNNSEYIPEFEKSFRYPQYWGAWLGAAANGGDRINTGIIPRPFAGDAGRFAGRLGKSSRRRALINLSLCFPQRSEAEREAIVDEMFATAPQAMAMMAELAMRGPKKIQQRVDWEGLEIIEEMRRNDEKVIFLVPHGWGRRHSSHADGLSGAKNGGDVS
ncbi:lipid A biosynthesis (KDO)2-(lauroyl)-lipid IVA acyltransferase [Salmonella enterica subsp. enterica serovar Typhimurium]|nr:lipid A biosynthesis (KDO)2-(lauroyl)-lipid IVA acyltransferase [Salmonella enterica subsp. enterica serovar Typhimurium]